MKKSMIMAVGLIASLSFNEIAAMQHLSNGFIYDASKTCTLTIKSFDANGFGFPSRTVGKGKKKLYIGEEKAAYYVIDSSPTIARVCLSFEKQKFVYYSLDTKTPIDKLTFRDIKNNNVRMSVKLDGVTPSTTEATTFVVDVVDGKITIKLILTKNLGVRNIGTDTANMSLPLGVVEPPVK